MSVMGEAAKVGKREIGKIFAKGMKEGIGAFGAMAGNRLLDSLLVPKYKERAQVTEDGDVDFTREQVPNPDVRDPGFARKVHGYDRKDFGDNTFMNFLADHPETAARTAQIGAPTAVFAGMAAAGTMLDGIFGGKPSSEYKVPVQPRSYQSVTSATAGGGFGPYNNANIAASNASTANTAYLETLKHKHNLEVIRAKAQAREPGVQDIGDTSIPTPTPKSAAQAYANAIQKPSAMNEELMSFARMLYGTGLKL
jgi:hypothetical protein